MIDAQTKYVAIFGNPVSHSLSPRMHNAAFNHLGLNMAYLAFRVEEASDATTAMRMLGILGASITVPHKQTIMSHLDDLDEMSRAIGAVNTVSAQEGRLVGYNTDWLGVVRALEQVSDLTEKSCLILVAGGAARAAIYGLQSKSVEVLMMSRDEARGRSLAAEMDCTFVKWQSWDRLNVELLINATPVGMSANGAQTVVPSQWLKPPMVVMDMVYRPVETRLLRDAEAADCLCVSGLDMLLYQGAAQFEIWTGKKAPFEVMRQALIESLEDEASKDHR
jgi:shikimate dehydrogenase